MSNNFCGRHKNGPFKIQLKNISLQRSSDDVAIKQINPNPKKVEKSVFLLHKRLKNENRKAASEHFQVIKLATVLQHNDE